MVQLKYFSAKGKFAIGAWNSKGLNLATSIKYLQFVRTES